MRKPISKHGLRRAMERAQADGLVQWTQPTGSVIDHIWHFIEREAFEGRPRKANERRIGPDEIPAAIDTVGDTIAAQPTL